LDDHYGKANNDRGHLLFKMMTITWIIRLLKIYWHGLNYFRNLIF